MIVKKVPFGKTLPDDIEKGYLIKLGFNLTKLTKVDRYYILDIPESSSIRCEKIAKGSGASNKNIYNIYYNNVLVICINHETVNDLLNNKKLIKLSFKIKRKVVDEELAKNAEMKKLLAGSSAPQLAGYQKELIYSLDKLVDITLKYSSRYGNNFNDIPSVLSKLKRLREENFNEHDKVIASNRNYEELLNIFPNWNIDTRVNKNGIKCELLDVSPDYPMQCSMM